MLAFAVLVRDDDACWDVGDSHRRVGRIYRLSAVAWAAHNVDAKVVWIYLDLAIFDFWHDSDGDGRGVHATLAFGLWYALDAVSATLKFEPRVRSFTLYQQNDLFKAARVALALAHDLEFIPSKLGISGVGVKQIARKKRRFVSARSRADL